MEKTKEKTIRVDNPANLPVLSFKNLKKNFETNTLKEKKNRDVSGLKQSILALGYNVPMFIWLEGKYIVDGAGRVLALDLLEYEGYTIPDLPYLPILAKNKQEAKQKVIAISSMYGVITKDTFAEFILDMGEMDLGFANIPGLVMEEIDWNPKEKKEYEVKEDEAPDVPVVPKSKVGDMYQLGRHRVLCGDALDNTAVTTLMGGKKADIFLTDPPYNVAYNNDSAQNLKARRRRQDTLTIMNDKMEDSKFREFLRSAFLNANLFLKAGGVFYIFHADAEGYNFRGACNDVEWKIRECLIWAKNVFVMGRQDYHWKHEPILYGWKEGAAHLWNSDRKQTTLLEFDRPSKSIEHPTMKPVKLIAYLLQNNTVEGNIVLDTFGGGGSALVAAEQTGRACYTMELDPRYVDVIVERWEKLTGKNAKKL